MKARERPKLLRKTDQQCWIVQWSENLKRIGQVHTKTLTKLCFSFDVSSMIAVESDCDTNATSDDIVEKDSFSTVEEEEDIQAENDSIDCNSTMK